MQEIVQEQITRVLLERLIVNRPHPWGLLITFIELIKVDTNFMCASSIDVICTLIFMRLNTLLLTFALCTEPWI